MQVLERERTRVFLDNQNRIWDDEEWNRGDVCERSRWLTAVSEKYRYGKIVPCGREDCLVCGREGSMLHRQRVMRGFKKIMCFKGVAYFVFTVPQGYRQFFNKAVLSEFCFLVKGVIKDLGYKRSVVRWHFGGERSKGVYNPHLNVLCDLDGNDGWIDEYILEGVKMRVKEWFKEKWGCEFSDEWLPVVNYSYGYSVGQSLHKWKYVCRPTLLLVSGSDDFSDLVNMLWGFRNIRWWGKWSKEELDGVNIEDKKDKEVVDIIEKDLVWNYRGSWSEVEKDVMGSWEYLGKGFFRQGIDKGG